MVVTRRFRDGQALACTSCPGPRPLRLAPSVPGLPSPTRTPPGSQPTPGFTFLLPAQDTQVRLSRPLLASEFQAHRSTCPLISLLPYSTGLSN